MTSTPATNNAAASPRPIPALRGTTGYRVPRGRQPIDLQLDANERTELPETALDALRTLPADTIRRYPSAANLESVIAARLDLTPDRILVTAGGDEAIDRVCRAFIDRGRELILPCPTFEMIDRYTSLAQGRIVRIDWDTPDFPLDDVLAAINEHTAVIPVVTPNNPTGASATAEDIERLAAAAPHAIILADLAYAEFMDDDPTTACLPLPNVVVVRTLSKAYALAGARVGFAAASPELIAVLRAAAGPYSVAAPSIALATARLTGDLSDVDRAVAAVRTERERLIDLLRTHSFEARPSQGNFVFCRGPRARWLRDALAGLGIAIRAWPDRPGLHDALRITLPGNQRMFDRLHSAIRAALDPQALFLDMDGILAETSQSYISAIIHTARTFGVSITEQQITAAKAAGNSNDDWILTHRFLSDAGIKTTLEEVIDRFERIYQGDGTTPGLKETEQLLIPRDTLDALASRLQLAVVTGRAMKDATYFLEHFGIANRFRTVVAMHCTPHIKPHPAPVREAMTRLNIERAWMLGDMPDDQTAARSAAVVPIGAVSAGMPADVMRPALEAAGAARVLEQAADIDQLLQEALP